MPVELTAKVEGLKGLERSLDALAKEFGHYKYALQAIRPAMRKALLIVSNQLKTRTPIDTGRLRDSIKITISKPNKNEKNNPNIPANTVLLGRVGWFWRKGEQSLKHRGLTLEFGNSKQPANPVLRPALENNFNAIIKTFSVELGKAITKKAEQLRKKNRGK